MTRRRRSGKRKEFLTGLERINLRVEFAVGPDLGAHTLVGEDCCESEARRLADLWAEFREDFVEDAPRWAMAVLERGEDPPWEPDERFRHGDPGQLDYLEHQRHLAEVARDHYREMSQ